jgi:hypothetical protein
MYAVPEMCWLSQLIVGFDLIKSTTHACIRKPNLNSPSAARRSTPEPMAVACALIRLYEDVYSYSSNQSERSTVERDLAYVQGPQQLAVRPMINQIN